MQDVYQEPIEKETREKPETAEEKKPPFSEAPIRGQIKETIERKAEAEAIKEEKEAEKTLEGEAGPAPMISPSSKVRKQVKKIKNLDRQNQIKTLVDLSFSKGLDFAIEVVRGLDNAYVLDEFHDALIDELYKKLVEQGKMKEL